jgi:SAM-dependent methyltransferase
MNIAKKALRKLYYVTLGRNAVIDRFFRYRRPHDYWKRRGGERYFEEQEAVGDRTERSLFIAGEVSNLTLASLLEIGCGYGKQLQNITQKKTGLSVAGCDFSRPQLMKGFEHFPPMRERVAEADAEFLPFKSRSFDAVMSSAVILHNDYRKAQRILWEMIRVSRKYLIHNEDTDVTFSRYGYDMTETYRALNFRILVSKTIPCSQDPAHTQFTVAEISSSGLPVRPDDIPLKYYKEPEKVRS